MDCGIPKLYNAKNYKSEPFTKSAKAMMSVRGLSRELKYIGTGGVYSNLGFVHQYHQISHLT